MAFVTEFLVALGLVTSVVHASPLAATTSAAATDCRAFTVNRCNFDKNGLIRYAQYYKIVKKFKIS